MGIYRRLVAGAIYFRRFLKNATSRINLDWLSNTHAKRVTSPP